MEYILLVVGFVLLVKGADFFVEGSSSVAKLLRVPAVIIGLTIVAFGTSAPEMAVSISASIAGSNDIAVGNVIGSNIFNILFVLGIAAALHPMVFQMENIIDIIVLVVMSAIVLCFAWTKQKLVRWEGAVMLAMYAGYVVYICLR